MAIVVKSFDTYTLRYLAAGAQWQNARAVVDCYRGDTWVAQLQFLAAEPAVGGGLGSPEEFVVLYYALARFHDVVDILRNEGPLAVLFDTGTTTGEITTLANEKVGEAEIVQPDRGSYSP
ncbi:hypothetical protein [Actinomycetospora sp. CA-053990]|uniref:hypothetical protein n=1 Tax=Actinomycetospora sp. CA-053990 TaxID=3239891 RepID=UPI003D947E7D